MRPVTGVGYIKYCSPLVCSVVRLLIRLQHPVDVDAATLGTHVQVTASQADVSRVGNVWIGGTLKIDQMPDKLQIAGEEVDAVLVVVHHEEMSFVDAA